MYDHTVLRLNVFRCSTINCMANVCSNVWCWAQVSLPTFPRVWLSVCDGKLFFWFSVEGFTFHMLWLSAERSFRPLDPCCLFPDIRAEGKHNTIQHTVLTKHNTTHCTQQNIRAQGTHNLSFNVNISFHHQSQCFHNTIGLHYILLKTRKTYFSKFWGVSLILSKDHIENVLSKEAQKERQMALCPSTDV